MVRNTRELTSKNFYDPRAIIPPLIQSVTDLALQLSLLAAIKNAPICNANRSNAEAFH